MNDHSLKERYKDKSTEELQAILLTAEIFDFGNAVAAITAEIKRRDREANDQSVSQNERKNC